MGRQYVERTVLIHQEDKAFVPGHSNRRAVTVAGSVQGNTAGLDLWAVRLVLGRRRGQRLGGAIGVHDERRGAGGQGQHGYQG